MRLTPRWIVLAASLGLAACASVAEPSRPADSRQYADHLIGRLANLRQDHEAAAQRYFDALARAPRDVALLDGAASASLAAGELDNARRAARLANGVTDAPPSIELIRATEAISAGRWRQAGDALERVEGRAAQNLTAAMLRSWVRAAEGRVDDVVTTLEPLAGVRPYGALFSYQQAMALDFSGRRDNALASYAAAARGGLMLAPAVEHNADLLARSGDRAGALALLTADGYRLDPGIAAARHRLEQGAGVAAAPLSPARGAAISLQGLATLFLQENDSTSALEALSLALMLDPSLDSARLVFAQTQIDLDHHETARRILAAVPNTSAYGASARVSEAWVLYDEGRKDEALAQIQIAAESGDLRARRSLADMYRNMARYAEAERVYGQLLSEQPNEWRLYFARGVARERQDRWADAEADLRRALELSPEQPDVMNYLAYSWIERGENMQDGLAMLERAVALRPASGAIVDSLGWAHYRLGDYAEALRHIERAVELLPSHPVLNDHLGDVYWRLNRRIEARFQWERALTLHPEDAEAIQHKIENGLPDEAPTLSARR